MEGDLPPISLGTNIPGLPKDIVEQLMAAKRRPIVQLEKRKENEEARLKLISTLSEHLNGFNSKFNGLSTFSKFQELKGSVGEPDLLDISINKELAKPGEYRLEILDLAENSSMISNGFADPNKTDIGVGYFSYELPNGEEREVYIDGNENTLYGIAKKINAQKDLNLDALVVNDGTGEENSWRLIVNYKDTGEVNDAEFPNFYFIGGDEDFSLDQERPARNAVLKVNGFSIEFDKSKINELLPGITLDLKRSAPGKEFTLKIEADEVKIGEKIKSFVGNMNKIFSFIQDQNKLGEDTDTSKTLGGDITIQNIESMLRRLVITPLKTGKGTLRLNDIGITFQRDGTLSIKEEKLNQKLETDLDSVKEYFAGINSNGNGFAGKAMKMIQNYTKINGTVRAREDGIKRRIQDIEKQIESKERELEVTKKHLKRKFSKLEATLVRLRSQQQQVQATLGGSSLLDQISTGG